MYIINVTSLANSGAGSLREAINIANAYNRSEDVRIVVDPSLAGQTISLSSALPSITKACTLQGNGIVLSSYSLTASAPVELHDIRLPQLVLTGLGAISGENITLTAQEAVRLNGWEVVDSDFSGVKTTAENAYVGIAAIPSEGEVSAELCSLFSGYKLVSNMSIPSDYVVTMEDGVSIDMSGYDLSVYGELNAEYTETQDLFTSSGDNAYLDVLAGGVMGLKNASVNIGSGSLWGRLSVHDNALLTMEGGSLYANYYNVVINAGGEVRLDGTNVQSAITNKGTLQIEDCTFSSYIIIGKASTVSGSGNIFTGGEVFRLENFSGSTSSLGTIVSAATSSNAYVGIYGALGNSTLSSFGDTIPGGYKFVGNVSISADSVVTVEDGVSIDMQGLDLGISGELKAEYTETQDLFTSSGDNAYLDVLAGGVMGLKNASVNIGSGYLWGRLSVHDNALLTMEGGSLYANYYNVVINAGGEARLDGTNVQCGISNQGTLQIEDCTFSSCITISNPSTVSGSGNTFTGDEVFRLENFSGSTASLESIVSVATSANAYVGIKGTLGNSTLTSFTDTLPGVYKLVNDVSIAADAVVSVQDGVSIDMQGLDLGISGELKAEYTETQDLFTSSGDNAYLDVLAGGVMGLKNASVNIGSGSLWGRLSVHDNALLTMEGGSLYANYYNVVINAGGEARLDGTHVQSAITNNGTLQIEDCTFSSYIIIGNASTVSGSGNIFTGGEVFRLENFSGSTASLESIVSIATSANAYVGIKGTLGNSTLTSFADTLPGGYKLVNNVSISADAVVTMQDGVSIDMRGYDLGVYGVLNAEYTETHDLFTTSGESAYLDVYGGGIMALKNASVNLSNWSRVRVYDNALLTMEGGSLYAHYYNVVINAGGEARLDGTNVQCGISNQGTLQIEDCTFSSCITISNPSTISGSGNTFTGDEVFCLENFSGSTASLESIVSVATSANAYVGIKSTLGNSTLTSFADTLPGGYRLVNNVSIAADAVVTMQDGVSIDMRGYDLGVYGELKAEYTEAHDLFTTSGESAYLDVYGGGVMALKNASVNLSNWSRVRVYDNALLTMEGGSLYAHYYDVVINAGGEARLNGTYVQSAIISSGTLNLKNVTSSSYIEVNGAATLDNVACSSLYVNNAESVSLGEGGVTLSAQEAVRLINQFTGDTADLADVFAGATADGAYVGLSSLGDCTLDILPSTLSGGYKLVSSSTIINGGNTVTLKDGVCIDSNGKSFDIRGILKVENKSAQDTFIGSGTLYLRDSAALNLTNANIRIHGYSMEGNSTLTMAGGVFDTSGGSLSLKSVNSVAKLTGVRVNDTISSVGTLILSDVDASGNRIEAYGATTLDGVTCSSLYVNAAKNVTLGKGGVEMTAQESIRLTNQFTGDTANMAALLAEVSVEGAYVGLYSLGDCTLRALPTNLSGGYKVMTGSTIISKGKTVTLGNGASIDSNGKTFYIEGALHAENSSVQDSLTGSGTLYLRDGAVLSLTNANIKNDYYTMAGSASLRMTGGVFDTGKGSLVISSTTGAASLTGVTMKDNIESKGILTLTDVQFAPGSTLTVANGSTASITGCTGLSALTLSAGADYRISGNDFSETEIILTDVKEGVMIDLSGNEWGTDDYEQIFSRFAEYASYITIDGVTGNDFDTYEVYNTDASGIGSLRSAIIWANSYVNNGVPTISVTESLAGQTITLPADLPAFTGEIILKGNGVTLGSYPLTLSSALELHDITLPQLMLTESGRVSGENITLTSQEAICLYRWYGTTDFDAVSSSAAGAYVGIRDVLGSTKGVAILTDVSSNLSGGYKLINQVTVETNSEVILEEGAVLNLSGYALSISGVLTVNDASLFSSGGSARLIVNTGGKLSLNDTDISLLGTGSSWGVYYNSLNVSDGAVLNVEGGSIEATTGVRISQGGVVNMEGTAVNTYIENEGQLTLTSTSHSNYVFNKNGGRITFDGAACSTLYLLSNDGLTVAEGGLTLTSQEALRLMDYSGSTGELLTILGAEYAADGAYVAITGSLGSAGEVTSLTDVSSVMSGGYKFVGDVGVAADCEVIIGEGEALNLNGYTLTVTGEMTANEASILSSGGYARLIVNTGGKVSLNDTDISLLGTGSSWGVYYNSLNVSDGAVLNVEGGSIEATTGVRISQGGVVNMEGTAVNTYIENEGQLTLTSTSHSNYVFNKNGGRITFDGAACSTLYLLSNDGLTVAEGGLTLTSQEALRLMDYSGSTGVLLTILGAEYAADGAYVAITGSLGSAGEVTSLTDVSSVMSGGYKFVGAIGVAEGCEVLIGEGADLNLNGYELTVTGEMTANEASILSSGGYARLIVNTGGKVSLNDTDISLLGTGSSWGVYYNSLNVSDGAVLNVEGGSIEATTGVRISQGGVVNMEGTAVNTYIENEGQLTLTSTSHSNYVYNKNGGRITFDGVVCSTLYLLSNDGLTVVEGGLTLTSQEALRLMNYRGSTGALLSILKADIETEGAYVAITGSLGSAGEVTSLTDVSSVMSGGYKFVGAIGVAEGCEVLIGEGADLNLNGYELTVTGEMTANEASILSSGGYARLIVNTGGKVSLNDTDISLLGTGSSWGVYYNSLNVSDGAVLNVEGGSIEATTGVRISQGGVVNMQGVSVNTYVENAGALTIEDNTFSTYVSTNNASNISGSGNTFTGAEIFRLANFSGASASLLNTISSVTAENAYMGVMGSLGSTAETTILSDISSKLSGNYKSVGSVTIADDSKVVLSEGAYLDLNSKGLNVNGELEANTSTIYDDGSNNINVNFGGHLILNDSALQLVGSSSSYNRLNVNARANVTVNGGSMAATGGVRISRGGTVTMEGVSVNTYVINQGALTIEDNTISGYISINDAATVSGSGNTFTGAETFRLENFSGASASLLNTISSATAENAYMGVMGSLGSTAETTILSDISSKLSGNYKSVGSVTIADASQVILSEGAYLDLNNRGLAVNGELETNSATLYDDNSANITVNAGGQLSLNDTALQLVGSSSSYNRLNVNNRANVTVNGGSMAATGGVRISRGGTVTMEGVSVNTYVINQGALTIEDNTISGYILINDAATVSGSGNTFTGAETFRLENFSGDTSALGALIASATADDAYVGITTLGDCTLDDLTSILPGGYKLAASGTVIGSRKTATLAEGVSLDTNGYTFSLYGTLNAENEVVADSVVGNGGMYLYSGALLNLRNANVKTRYYGMYDFSTLTMTGGEFDTISGSLSINSVNAAATLTDVTVKDDISSSGILTLADCRVEGKAVRLSSGSTTTITNTSGIKTLSIQGNCNTVLTGNDFSTTSISLTGFGENDVIDLSGNYWGEDITKEDIIAKISGYNENNVILDSWLVGLPEANFVARRLVGDTFASAETRSMTIKFSHMVDESTISGNVHLENLMGDIIEVSSWSHENGELTLNFAALPADGKYHVVIGAGLKNEHGKSIQLGAGAEDVRFDFMADVHAEIVTEVRLPDSLSPGYVDIMLDGEIASAMQASDWQLTAPDGSVVTVTRCSLYTPRIVRLQVAELPAAGVYTLSLPAGLQDAAGNKVSTESVQFTLESADAAIVPEDVLYDGLTNGAVRVTFSVSNAGNLAVTDAKVEIWLTTNGVVTASSVLLDIASIPELSVGGTVELSRDLLLSDVPGLKAGDYKLVATVEGGKELKVLTDDNSGCIGNLAVSYPPAADFALDIEHVESQLTPGETTSLTITLRNEGTVAAAGALEMVYGIMPYGGNVADMLQLGSEIISESSLGVGQSLTLNPSLTLPADIMLGGNVQLVAVLKTDVYEQPGTTANNTALSEVVQLEKLLTISPLSDSIKEGGSRLVYTISRTGDCSRALTVNLSCEQAARLGLPQTVTIAAGQSSARLQASVVNDKNYIGDVETTISVSADGYTSASSALTIIEDELPTISLSLIPAEVTEGNDTVLLGTVSIDTVSTEDIVVKLGSNLSGQIKAPASVIIKAGETSATFEATVVDDTTAEIDKEVKITGAAAGFNSGSATVLVKDNDLPQVELVFSKEIVSESDGYYALTATLVRKGGSNEAITVRLKDVDGIGLILPSSVPMGAGVQSVKFTIGVVDDAQANGVRTGKVRGSIIIDDCGCDASTSSNGGMFETTLTVQDNDSPALTLSLSKSVLREGGEEKAVLTIKSNYVSATDVVVTLSDGGMLNLPATIIIPAGSTSVTCEISALSDGVSDGTQYTTITGSADGFISGRAYMQVTDMDMPDLVVDSITMETAAVAKQTATVCIVLRNQGYAPMSKATPVEIRLSDGTVLGSVMVESGLEAGASTTITTEILLPERSGQYHLVAEVDRANSLAELDNDNNIKVGESILITSGYSVTADFGRDVLYSAGRVTITGVVSAQLESMAVGGIPVSLGIYCNGVLLTSLSSVTAEDGTYAVDYDVPKGFAGEFSVRAGVFSEESEVLDVISVAGLKNTTATKELQWLIDQDGSMIGRITVTNIGSEVLRGVQLLPGELPDNLRINVLTSARDIAVGGSATFEFEMIGGSPTIGDYYSVVPFKVVSQEGTSVDITGYSYVQKAKADVEISVRLLETTVNRTDVCYLEFTLTNTGAGDSGQINVTLPQLDWMQLYSGAVIENLAYGESATVVLKVDAAKVESLLTNVPYTGALAVNSENGGGGLVNFDITFVEKEKCSLSISAMDSFSLKLDDKSNIANASVRLYNAYTRELEASGYTDESGKLLFDNLEAGDYYLYIDADKCDRYKTNVSLRPGQDAVLEAYLENSTVDYVFNVTPSEIEDKYEITIESEFVTSVPRAVVVFDKNVYELPDMRPGDTVYFTMTVSNYGLVAADQFRLELPQADNMKFTLVSDPIDRLDAQSSHEFWVKAEALPGVDVDYTEKSGNIIEDILCYLGQSYSFWVDCDGMGGWNFNFTTIQTNPEFCIPDAPSGPDPEKTPDKRPSNGGGGGEGPWLVYGPGFMLSWMGTSCTPCKAALVNVVLAAKGLDGYSFSGSFTDAVLSKSQLLDTLNSVNGMMKDASWMGNVTRQGRECILSFKPSNKAAIEQVSSSSSQAVGILQVVKPSRLEIQDDADGTKWVQAKIDLIEQLLENRKAVLIATLSTIAPFEALNTVMVDKLLEAFAQDASESEKAAVAKEYGEAYGEWINVILSKGLGSVNADLRSTEKMALSGADISQLISMHLGTLLGKDVIMAACEFWNRTVEYNSRGIYSTESLGKDDDPNFLSLEKLIELESYLENLERDAKSAGYASLEDFLEGQRQLISDQIVNESDSVCATVKLNFKQTATMSREAFDGYFSMTNGDMLQGVENVRLKVYVVDSNGVDVTEHFRITYEVLNGFAGMSGEDGAMVGGSLAAGESGEIAIQYIPDATVAADGSAEYQFGATLHYSNVGDEAVREIGISPVPLTVNPSPSLTLHYFLTEDVYSDDPFTAEIEAAMRSEIGLLIENKGLGVAKNFTMSEFTPEFVANEQGLALELQMLGSSINGGALVASGSNLNFGNIEGHSTTTAVWYFSTNLQGEFYVDKDSAKFTRIDSLGDTEYLAVDTDISLIESVTAHRLTRSMDVDGDGKTDFLVNDEADIADMAESLYLGKGGCESVNAVTGIYSTSGTLGMGNTTITLTMYMAQGWNYFRVNDPGQGNYRVESISMGGVKLSDSAIWQTDRVFDGSGMATYVDRLHWVCEATEDGYVDFTITYSATDDKAPGIKNIAGVIDKATIREAVEEITVIFDEEVNTATFSLANISLKLQNDYVDITGLTWEWAEDGRSVRFTNMSQFTEADGLYVLTVLNGGVEDTYGNAGDGSGRQVMWTRATSKVAVELVEGHMDRQLNKRVDILVVTFTEAVATFGMDALSIIHTALDGTQSVVTNLSGITISAADSSNKKFIIAGLSSVQNSGDGSYNFQINADKVLDAKGNRGTGVMPADWNLHESPPSVLRSSFVKAEQIVQSIDTIILHFSHDVSSINLDKLTLTCNGEVYTSTALRFEIDANDRRMVVVKGISEATPIGKAAALPDGEWELSMDLSGVEDIYGNVGSGVYSTNWEVDTIAPSALVGITINGEESRIVASTEFTIGATLPESGLNVRIYDRYIVGSEQDMLLWQGTVEGTELSQKLSLMNGGSRILTIVTTDAAGNSTTNTFNVFVDMVVLTVSTDLGDKYKELPESISITFNAATSDLPLSALGLTVDGRAISLDGATLTRVSDIQWELSGLSGISSSVGTYALSIDLSSVSKTLSGLQGQGTYTQSFFYDPVSEVRITGCEIDSSLELLSGISISFSTAINYAELQSAGLLQDAVRLVNQADGSVVELPASGFAYADNTLTWSGELSLGGGSYAVVVDSALLTAANGAPLVGNDSTVNTAIVNFRGDALLLGAAGDSYSAPYAVDWNGDGRVDLLVGEKVGSEGKVRLYINNGNGGFANYTYLQSNGSDLSVSASGCQGIVVALQDLNGDNIADLVAGLSDGRVLSFAGSADGSFGSAVELFSSSVAGSRAYPTFYDWNHDGTMDIILGTGSGSLMVGLGTENAATGALSFATPTVVAGIEVPGRAAPVFADVNSDGVSDLILGDANGGLTLYYGSASGYYKVANWELPGVNWERSRVTVGDVNRDGATDLIVGGSTGDIYVVYGENAAGAWSQVFDVAAKPSVLSTSFSLDGTTATFGWQSKGANDDTVYLLEISSNPFFDENETLVLEVTGTGKVMEMEQGSYFWRVSVKGSDTPAREGAAFTVDTIAPNAPSDLAASVSNGTVTFTWASQSDPSGVIYELRYSTTSDFSSSRIYSRDTNSISISGLAAGDYYWQVRTVDLSGNISEWTTAEHAFTMEEIVAPEATANIHWAKGLATSEGQLVDGWWDADKTGVADSQLCWAAASANMLAWWQVQYGLADFSTSVPGTADAIFGTMSANWANVSGREEYGLVWWISGESESSSYNSYHANNFTGNGEDGCYFSHLYGAADTAALVKEVSLTGLTATQVATDWATIYENGGMLSLGIYRSLSSGTLTGGHTLTLWGFATDSAGRLASITVTDSDDGKDSALTLNLAYNVTRGYYQIAQSDSNLNGYMLGDYTALGAFTAYDSTNNDVTEAEVLTLSTPEDGATRVTTTNWVGAGDMLDYYVFAATGDGAYKVGIDSAALSDSLMISIGSMVDDKFVVQRSMKLNPNDTIYAFDRISLIEGQLCYILVENAEGAAGSEYSLTVTGDIMDKDVLITDNNTKETATELQLVSSTDAATNSWVGAGDAQDHYRLEMTEAGNLTIKLSSLDKNASVTLYQDRGNGVYQRKYSATAKVVGGLLRTLSLSAGTYIVEVSAYDNGAGRYDTSYALELETKQGDDTKRFVVMGDNPNITYNNTMAAATQLELVSDTDAAISSWVGTGDALDFYRLEMAESGRLDISLSELEKNTNISVYQDRGNGKYLRRLSVTANAENGLDQTLSLTAGTYFIEVASYDNGAGRYNSSYTLELEQEVDGETKRFAIANA